jgi:hypothetical protein
VRRKGPDVLLEAYKRAFAERNDVELVMKDFGAEGIYRGGDRDVYRKHAESGALPRLTLLGGEISTDELAELYRSADVFVHPYRGEGFNMPVLEAMACGLPVITTAGGPTDEFCPPPAGWRIDSTRAEISAATLGEFTPVSTPWMLEPDLDQLVELLQAAAADPGERAARGRAARTAAEALSWDAVAARYEQRIAALVSLTPQAGRGEPEPFPLSAEARLRVLAVPAWQGTDQLAELLAAWGAHTTRETSACLYLLADPALAGDPEATEGHVVEAATRAGLDLDACADIDVLMEPLQAERDARLHLAMTAFVPLHAASAGHTRLARQAGCAIVPPGTDLERLLISAS